MESSLKSKIQKWGNSLAVRIPKAFADEIGIAENASIDMMVEDGTLHIVPDRDRRWTLENLLSRVTEENRHGEWETGSSEGDEAW